MFTVFAYPAISDRLICLQHHALVPGRQAGTGLHRQMRRKQKQNQRPQAVRGSRRAGAGSPGLDLRLNPARWGETGTLGRHHRKVPAS